MHASLSTLVGVYVRCPRPISSSECCCACTPGVNDVGQPQWSGAGVSKEASALPCQHVAVGLHVHERQRGERRWDASCPMPSLMVSMMRVWLEIKARGHVLMQMRTYVSKLWTPHRKHVVKKQGRQPGGR